MLERRSTYEVVDIPESTFVAHYRDTSPQPKTRITSQASWRKTATGQVATNATLARGRGRGRGRERRGRGRGAPYWLWGGDGDGEPSSSQPEEFQNSEANTTQNAPKDNSDEN